MAVVKRYPQAIRLLSWQAAWRRAGLFTAKGCALAGLSWLFTVTTLEVAALAARIAG